MEKKQRSDFENFDKVSLNAALESILREFEETGWPEIQNDKL